MFESFHGSISERLDRPSYHEDFRRHYESGIRFLNKLERGQSFKERGFPSWEAFAVGEWDSALSLIEEKREIYAAQLRKAEELGILERRLRVVEFPVTPYVQWELFVLRLRVELGGNIRVMDARKISDIEADHLVPEAVILGDEVMYEVVYDDDGNAAGANRITDQAAIAETSAGFDTLYHRGEDFLEFFHREIASLDPPSVVHR
ncbi:DUF6879 family protein [Streptomyces tubercidicus]|uniref:DUF6879 domain-containing protein n=1 Tax=Streptomyces tubercidicus TaxID=47759 RepID=A0A640UXU5_9ACTN|nr:DUF6879 family protein [Streptomyces tubercidicus]WAU14492.1 hypothetical protein STRTU_005115 [Streptomyces tubercidicus]GFE40234.1 hypothetical protein Stube_49070 [Streptomyces tubercidicus]